MILESNCTGYSTSLLAGSVVGPGDTDTFTVSVDDSNSSPPVSCELNLQSEDFQFFVSLPIAANDCNPSSPVTISPSSGATLDFGNIAVGTMSASPVTFTVFNDGVNELDGSVQLQDADFSIPGFGTDESLNAIGAGSSTTVDVQFAPNHPGLISSTLSIFDNSFGIVSSVELTGYGFAVESTSTSVPIDNNTIGNMAASVFSGLPLKTISVANDDSGANIRIDYTTLGTNTPSVTCTAQDDGSSCTLSTASNLTSVPLTCTASVGGNHTATVTVTDIDDNAASNTVSCTGNFPTYFFNPGYQYSTLCIGDPYPNVPVTLTSNGPTPLTVTGFLTDGVFAFAWPDQPRVVLTAGTSTSGKIEFTPPTPAVPYQTYSDTLTAIVSPADPNSSTSLSLNVQTIPVFDFSGNSFNNETTINFPPTVVGQQSPPYQGQVQLNICNAHMGRVTAVTSGNAAFVVDSSNPAFNVDATGNVFLTMHFAPTAAISYSAGLMVSFMDDDGTPQVANVNLSGQGVAPDGPSYTLSYLSSPAPIEPATMCLGETNIPDVPVTLGLNGTNGFMVTSATFSNSSLFSFTWSGDNQQPYVYQGEGPVTGTLSFDVEAANMRPPQTYSDTLTLMTNPFAIGTNSISPSIATLAMFNVADSDGNPIDGQAIHVDFQPTLIGASADRTISVSLCGDHAGLITLNAPPADSAFTVTNVSLTDGAPIIRGQPFDVDIKFVPTALPSTTETISMTLADDIGGTKIITILLSGEGATASNDAGSGVDGGVVGPNANTNYYSAGCRATDGSDSNSMSLLVIATFLAVDIRRRRRCESRR